MSQGYIGYDLQNALREKLLDRLTPEEAEGYMAEGHFAPGSMLPKVQAAVEFAKSAPGRSALITLLEAERSEHRSES